MRYFKYENTSSNRNNALKEQYKRLTEDEKRTFRKEKCWRTISVLVTLIVYFAFIINGIFLLKSVPMPQAPFLKVLVQIAKVMIGFSLFIASGMVAAPVTAPLWKKAASFHIPTMRKEIFSKACEHLREYYELEEPYIITKCFDATDKKFQNHDVCIFIVDDELRITTNLVQGFLYGERDLGCYAFKQEEIALSKQKSGDHLIAELRADNMIFLLGYRAKGFVEKKFLKKSVK